MTANVEVRNFIKAEALKQFDNDYDVLYNYVRDEKIGGTSFREILLAYFSDPGELAEIESTIPALTIFVPTLPENSFSAETWNTSTDIPMVAIRLLDNNNTPLISSDSESYLLGHDVIPGFPVIVLKECERIVIPDFPLYSDNKTTEYVAASGFKFKFANIYYDFITLKGPVPTPPDDNENKVIAAWNKNKDLPLEDQGWDRDYIYYSIYENHPNGLFANTHAEKLTAFGIEGSTAWNALNNISDASSVNNNFSDPDLWSAFWGNSNINQGSFWTDGKFDFNVYIEYDANNPSLEKTFDTTPEDLFVIEYEITKQFGSMKYYRIKNLSRKTYNVDLEILTWRLHDYSNEWAFKIEEVDLHVEISNQETRQSKYNTNFSLDVASGEKIKLGGKFGVTTESVFSTVKTTKWTEESEDLGKTIVNFGDKVIIDEHPSPLGNNIIYMYRRYNTGKASFSLIPKKVQ